MDQKMVNQYLSPYMVKMDLDTDRTLKGYVYEPDIE